MSEDVGTKLYRKKSKSILSAIQLGLCCFRSRKTKGTSLNPTNPTPSEKMVYMYTVHPIKAFKTHDTITTFFYALGKGHAEPSTWYNRRPEPGGRASGGRRWTKIPRSGRKASWRKTLR